MGGDCDVKDRTLCSIVHIILSSDTYLNSNTRSSSTDQ
jgi:hypothetical protein